MPLWNSLPLRKKAVRLNYFTLSKAGVTGMNSSRSLLNPAIEIFFFFFYRGISVYENASSRALSTQPNGLYLGPVLHKT
jgi:hypothetical protein